MKHRSGRQDTPASRSAPQEGVSCRTLPLAGIHTHPIRNPVACQSRKKDKDQPCARPCTGSARFASAPSHRSIVAKAVRNTQPARSTFILCADSVHRCPACILPPQHPSGVSRLRPVLKGRGGGQYPIWSHFEAAVEVHLGRQSPGDHLVPVNAGQPPRPHPRTREHSLVPRHPHAVIHDHKPLGPVRSLSPPGGIHPTLDCPRIIRYGGPGIGNPFGLCIRIFMLSNCRATRLVQKLDWAKPWMARQLGALCPFYGHAECGAARRLRQKLDTGLSTIWTHDRWRGAEGLAACSFTVLIRLSCQD